MFRRILARIRPNNKTEDLAKCSPSSFQGYEIGDNIKLDGKYTKVTGLEYNNSFGPSLWVENYGLVPLADNRIEFVSRLAGSAKQPPTEKVEPPKTSAPTKRDGLHCVYGKCHGRFPCNPGCSFTATISEQFWSHNGMNYALSPTLLANSRSEEDIK